MDAASLFAPALTGDGQTANSRIINVAQSGKKPWTAIGNFLIPGLGGYCSAVLVAPRIVLTANHCLYAVDFSKADGKGGQVKQLMDAKRFVFVAGLHDDSFADVIPVEEVITGGWKPGGGAGSEDWVIAILARPVNSKVVPIAFRSYEPAEVDADWKNKVVVAGYPGASVAFSGVLRFSFNCSILTSSSADGLSHDCLSEGGSSGSPVFVEQDDELRLIGIHSSVRMDRSGSKNGVSINSFIAKLNDAVDRFR